MKIKDNKIESNGDLNVFDFNISQDIINTLASQCKVVNTVSGDEYVAPLVVDCGVVDTTSVQCTATTAGVIQCNQVQCTDTQVTVRCTSVAYSGNHCATTAGYQCDDCTTIQCNTIQCNYSNNCYSNNYYSDQCKDDSGCFVSGCVITKRGLIDISMVDVGDEIWGVDDHWHVVLDVASNCVGDRKVYKLLHDGIVTSDHVIYSGSCAYVPSMTALNATGYTKLIGKNGVEGRYGIPEVLEIDGAGLFTVDKTTPTYSPICDKSFVGYLNGDRVLFAGKL